MSTTSSSKPERFQYRIYPSLYANNSWYIYRIDIKGSYDLIGPYMNENEAQVDLRNLERGELNGRS